MPDAPGPQGIQAGRLEVPVVADLTGFATKLREGVRTAATGLKAAVNVDVDEKSLASARGQIEAAMEGITADVEVRVDEDRTRNYLREVLGRASRGLKAQVQLEADTTKLKDDLDRRFAVNREGTITVGADTKSALAEAETTRSTIDRMRASIGVTVDRDRLRASSNQIGQNVQRDMQALVATLRKAGDEAAATRRQFTSVFNTRPVERFLSQVGRALTAFGLITGIVSVVEGLGSALTGLVGGLSAVVGGLYAIVAASGPAIAGLAVIPNLIAAAAQAGATLFAAFSGIGAAIGAIRQQENAVTGASQNAAQAQVDNARRIADARRSVSDAIENGARRVEAAERSLVNAQEQSRTAQERLNDARRDAKERLEDLNLELRQAAIDEESAAIGVERAKERLADVQANPFATELDKREAELQYQQALQRVDEVAERNDDLAREGGELRKKGVEGSDQVVAAKRAIVDAQRAELDAERALAQARRDSTRAIADAQRRLTDAQRQAAGPASAVATANSNLEQALAKLSPEARSFAYFIADELVPALEGLRNKVAAELLPTIESGLRRLLNGQLFEVLTGQLVESARGAAGWFERLFDLLNSPQFSRDFDFIGDGNQRALKDFGDATLSLLNVFRDIMVVVAQPGGLLDTFSGWVKEVAGGWEESTSFNRETGKMFDFFDRSARIIGLWGDIFRNTWDGLVGLGSAGSEAGEGLLVSLREATGNFAQWTEDNREKLEGWFDSVAETTRMVGDIINDVVIGLGKIADDENTQAMVKALRDDVIPAIGRLVEALQESEAGQKFADFLVEAFDMITAIINSGGFQKFLEVMTNIFREIKEFAQSDGGSKVIGFLAGLFGVLGAASLVLGPLARVAGVLFRIVRVLGKGGAKALQFLFGATVGGGGVLAGAGRGVAGAAAAAGGGGLLASLFGRGGAKGGVDLAARIAPYTLGGAAGVGAAAPQQSRFARLFAGRGGRIGIAAGIAGVLGLGAFGATRANAEPPSLLYDPEVGIFVDPNTGVAFDPTTGQPLSYGANDPPPGAPGVDGLGLALGGGALAYAGRTAIKKPSSTGYTSRVGLNLTRQGASTGIRNAIKAFGPKAFKVGAGPIGIASLGVDFLGSAIDSGRADFRGNAASVLKGAGGGAAIGAMVGSVVPVVGTALGAAAGAVIGGLVGWIKRPNAQLLAMKENAVEVGENIYKWSQAGRGGEIPDLAFRNVGTALQDVGVAAFEAARDQGTYVEALNEADEAMKQQYEVIKSTLMEAYGLTEAEVVSLIGTYDDYNARQVLPKTLRAQDDVTHTVEDIEERLDEFNEKNGPDHLTTDLNARDNTTAVVEDLEARLEEYAQKPGPDHLTKDLVAEDRASQVVDDLEARLDEFAAKPGPDHLTKTLDADDKATAQVDRVTERIAGFNEFRVYPKLLAAADGASPVLANAIDKAGEYNHYPVNPKHLTWSTNANQVAAGIAGVINSIPNVVHKYVMISPIFAQATSEQRQRQLATTGVLSPSYRSELERRNSVFGAAEGVTVRPQTGGTLVRVAEAGRAETIVDEGLQNEMLRKVITMLERQGGDGKGRVGVLVAEGAIQQTVYNPAPEPASTSLSRRMRQAAEFGFEGLGD